MVQIGRNVVTRNKEGHLQVGRIPKEGIGGAVNNEPTPFEHSDRSDDSELDSIRLVERVKLKQRVALLGRKTTREVEPTRYDSTIDEQ